MTAGPADRRPPFTRPVAGRDWAADIDAAIDAVVDGQAPVELASADWSPGGEPFDMPVLRMCFAGQVGAPASPWSAAPDTGEAVAVAHELFVALGPAAGCDVETVRRAGVAAGRRLPSGPVRVDFPAGFPFVAAVVDGLVIGHAAAGRRHPVRLVVDPADRPQARIGLATGRIVALAALLVSAPPNVLNPATAAQWARSIAARTGLECTVLERAELAAQGFGAVLAIGDGSVVGPRLVQLRYPGREATTAAAPDRPANPPGRPRKLALVGKGVTFDSGGLSLKSPAAQQTMRLDVAGAAAVLAVMAGLPGLGGRTEVTAVLPFVENLPGPGAARPGDVATAWNGTQIQILDTDFEGRVILADALALAAAARPDLIVDLASLTYQAEIALGPEIGALLARDDKAAHAVLAAASLAGEPMWQLPWATRYLDQVRTPFGVRNHPLHDSGRAITAALFLGEFVPPDQPWVHLDMAGPAWAGDASMPGGTGFGARTLLQLVTDPAAPDNPSAHETGDDPA